MIFILRFDILLDHRLKPWLLEVNHGPSFATESFLDHDVKFELIKDTLNIIVFKIKARLAEQDFLTN